MTRTDFTGFLILFAMTVEQFSARVTNFSWPCNPSTSFEDSCTVLFHKMCSKEISFLLLEMLLLVILLCNV